MKYRFPIVGFIALVVCLVLSFRGPVLAADGEVLSHQKISSTAGGYPGTLANFDYFGYGAASIGDLDNDGVTDLAVSAFRSTQGAYVEILFLNSNGTVKDTERINDTFSGGGGQFTQVSSLGDLDGDGVLDLAVGAPMDGDGGYNHGAVWILFLNADGTVKTHQKISSLAGGFAGTLVSNDRFGSAVTSLNDLDGDGITDIAVGAAGDWTEAVTGAVWILFLNTDGTVKAHRKISGGEGGFTGSLNNGERFGQSVTRVNDLDVDGIPELVVGAHTDDDGASNSGSIWILFLNADGTVKLHQKISNASGGFSGSLGTEAYFGHSLTSFKDLDGDCVADLAVGSYKDSVSGFNRGAVWILFLNTDGTVKAHRKISGGEGGFTGQLDDEDQFGISVASLGDLNGDAVPDLAVGAAPDDDGGADRGAVWILFLDGFNVVMDFDGDGFVNDVDCDDCNTDVHPGAPEICDGFANDCDDSRWPSLPANESDIDRDGWSGCTGDCNESDPNINPGMPEINCDGINNDCNAGTVDVQDMDGDTFDCTIDCNDADGFVWSQPDEVQNLRLRPWPLIPSLTEILWDASSDSDSAVTYYGLIKSQVADDFSSIAACLTDPFSPGIVSTVDFGSSPALGTAFYYLVRAENPCGIGSFGTQSDGTPRTGISCP